MEGCICMSVNELKRLEIVTKVIEKRFKQVEAADILYISVRQMKRLVKKFRVDKHEGLVSKKRGFPTNHLDSKQFQVCFIKWTQILKSIMGKRIAIDGKTLRGSKDKNQSALHLVSAFATESSLVLGQIKTNGKRGEFAGIGAAT